MAAPVAANVDDEAAFDRIEHDWSHIAVKMERR